MKKYIYTTLFRTVEYAIPVFLELPENVDPDNEQEFEKFLEETTYPDPTPYIVFDNYPADNIEQEYDEYVGEVVNEDSLNGDEIIIKFEQGEK